MSRPSVLLADDSSAIVRHVSRLLQRDNQYEVVATARDGAGVLREFQRFKPDVIVLDISMGELSGIDVARHLRDSGCYAKIVFLTVHEDSDFLAAAMGSGGSAYVIKSRLDIDLLAAIRAVLNGRHFVSANLLQERDYDHPQ